MNENRERRKMHADEVTVADSLVRVLIDTQFPQWSGLALHRIPSTGTDNLIYRLGDEMGVRLPRIHWAVSQIDKEWIWLRRLAPELPVPVPIPLAQGEPGFGYPYPWLVYPWIEGEDLQHSIGLDLNRVQGTSLLSWSPCKERTSGISHHWGRGRAHWHRSIGKPVGRSDVSRASTSIVSCRYGTPPCEPKSGGSLRCGPTGISLQRT